VTELSNTGFVVYSSYLGGSQGENAGDVGSTGVLSGAIAVDLSGNAYLAGSTNSADFPLQSPYQNAYGGGAADAFVTKVAAAPPDFSIAVSPSSISTISGLTSAAITVTVSSVNASFAGAVNLSCSGKPPLAACNFATTSLTPTTTPATTNLTISTNGSAGNGSLSPLIVPKSGIFYAMLLPLGGLALVGAGFGRGRTQKVLGLVFFAMVGATFLLSCGGTGISASPTPNASCAAAPSAPTGLAATATSATGTSLNWSAAGTPASCSVSAYTVYQNGKSIGTTPNTNFAVTGLSPGTPYSFTVAATDAFGASAQSSAAKVTTGTQNTPPGTYTITVVGTDANNPSHSHSVDLAVTVQ
jgi:hypothetical protein